MRARATMRRRLRLYWGWRPSMHQIVASIVTRPTCSAAFRRQDCMRAVILFMFVFPRQ